MKMFSLDTFVYSVLFFCIDYDGLNLLKYLISFYLHSVDVHVLIAYML